MPNLITPAPPELTENVQENLKRFKDWGAALIDDLTYLFAHLDSANVIEAGSVKAENIDVSNAQIESAQIGSISADKIQSGVLNTNKILIADEGSNLTITGNVFSIRDGLGTRFAIAYEKAADYFEFGVFDKQGNEVIGLHGDGNACFQGRVTGSEMYASTIVGTDLHSYQNYCGGVFAQLDPTGIKMMHDQNYERLQKLGMSVGDDGTAYVVLGAGNGEGRHQINGVVYTNGSFKIEKNDSYASLGLVGYMPQIFFWEGSENLWLSGNRVLINGIDVLSKLDALTQRVAALDGGSSYMSVDADATALRMVGTGEEQAVAKITKENTQA